MAQNFCQFLVEHFVFAASLLRYFKYFSNFRLNNSRKKIIKKWKLDLEELIVCFENLDFEVFNLMYTI